ncbi:hypothetical protein DEU51_11861 [Pseudomonas jessenii]|uniref:Uncharacterized protein n=1 Tax=Pseudomonas jessenii TaxID=77298 RepID=A0A370S4Z7_PSEJE|nr:hypothetical protein DEU51_11861 [Pseudomonas jessenii]
MPLNKARIGVSAALIGCTFASTAHAASEHEMAVGGAALYQVCAQKHPPVSAYLSPLLIDSTTHGGEGV